MRISTGIRPALVAAVALLMLAACGSSAQGNSGGSGSSGSSGSGTPTPAATPTPASSGASGQVKAGTVTVQGKSETVFTNSAGLTLYYYTPDKDASVTCTGGCAAAWPPCSNAAPAAGSISGATGTFGTDPNPAGGTVVTYNGWPLYTFAHDSAPGQANGQGLQGVWFVATPSLAATPTGQ